MKYNSDVRWFVIVWNKVVIMRNSQFLDIVKLWAVVELLKKFSGDGGGGGGEILHNNYKICLIFKKVSI